VGFYFARARRTGHPSITPSVTWREYLGALAVATERSPVSAGARRGAARQLREGPHEPTLAALSGWVQRRPGDEAAHRLLGLTHLACGQLDGAARHLEMALRIVRRQSRGAVELADALGLQIEAAKLRLVLIPVYGRLGKRAQAQALARGGHVDL
jgi:Flp pilus assembly protein TadD